MGTTAPRDHAPTGPGDRSRRARPPIVAVLGVDGAGKSTLSRRLAVERSRDGRTCLIGDRLERFRAGEPERLAPPLAERLRRWILARARRSGSLARYKVPKMADLLLRDRLLGTASRGHRPDAVFMDGMPLLNMTAWAVLYHESHLTRETCARILAILAHRSAPQRGDPLLETFPELARLHRLHLDHLRVPEATLFLDVPPRVCIERIQSRGKATQAHETEDSLTRLREAYLLVCTTLSEDWKLPVTVLDGARPLDDVVAEARAFLDRALEVPRVP